MTTDRLLDRVDWSAEGLRALELLRSLLRFDTTNPPGDEAASPRTVKRPTLSI